MKHIKTFESNIVSQPESDKYKKHIIIKSGRQDILYYILMNIEEKDNNTIIYKSYSFYYNYGHQDDGKKLRIQKSNGIYHNTYQILYQTDDFDDAVKMLNIIRTSNKYNL